MGAYHRKSGEDRTAGVLATVLDRVPAFVDQLAQRVGLAPAEAYRVETQVRSGRIIDLEITAEAGDGTAAWLLWSEHKVNDPLTGEQLKREAAALAAKAALVPHRLIAVTLYSASAEARDAATELGVELLRWDELLRLGQRAAAQITRAMDGDATRERSSEVEEQMLLEWSAFCEHELEAAVEPLTVARVGMLVEAQETLETWTISSKSPARQEPRQLAPESPRNTTSMAQPCSMLMHPPKAGLQSTVSGSS